MAAAVDLLGDLDARVAAADVERADTLGAVDLVAGEREDVDVVGVTLTGILPTAWTASVWKRTPFSWQSSPISRMGWMTPISLLAYMMETRMVCCLRADGALEVFEVDEAVGLDGQVGDAVARLFELLAGVEHGLVLGDLGDDVVAALAVHLGDALDGEVVGLGGAGGEDDLLGGGADELGDLLAGLLDGLLGFPAEAVVAAGGVAEVAGEVRHHGFEHAGVERRGGVVVHVDGQLDALGQGLVGLGDVHSECFCHVVVAPELCVGADAASAVRLRVRVLNFERRLLNADGDQAAGDGCAAVGRRAASTRSADADAAEQVLDAVVDLAQWFFDGAVPCRSQVPWMVMQLVMKSGPSMARMTSKAEISCAGRARA